MADVEKAKEKLRSMRDKVDLGERLAISVVLNELKKITFLNNMKLEDKAKMREQSNQKDKVIELMSKCINNLRFRPYHAELKGKIFSNAKEVERHFKDKVKGDK